MHTPPLDVDPLALKIAVSLGEADPAAQAQIARALERHGSDFVQALVAEALDIERSGGMFSRDGSYKRSLGGTFFYLLRERTRPTRPESEQPTQGDASLLTWDERFEAVRAALARPGIALSARMTVVGRPQTVTTQEDFIVLTLQSKDKLPPLPNDLPLPPTTASTIKVCVSEPQWRRVKRALDNPEEALVITGYAIPNLKQQTVVVFATWVTSKLWQPAYHPGTQKERPTWK